MGGGEVRRSLGSMEPRQTLTEALSLLSGFARGGKLRQTPRLVLSELSNFVEVLKRCELRNRQRSFWVSLCERSLRYTQEGKIGGRYEKGKTRSVLVYDEEELRAFKTDLTTKTYKPTVDSTPTNPDKDGAELSRFVEVPQPLPLLEGLSHLADVLKAIREEQEVDRLTVPIHHKLTLSLAYAVRPFWAFPPETTPSH